MASFYIHISFLSFVFPDRRIIFMNGIIADLLFGFVLSPEEEHKGYYQALTLGYFDEIASRFEDAEADFVMMTKLGVDNEAMAVREYYASAYHCNLRYAESTSYPTAISVEGDNRLRYSALGDIREADVLSFIDECDITVLFISSTLLSFRPVSREIVSAVLKRKEKLEKVVVDTTLDWDILLLEEVRECMEMMRDSSVPVYIVGEALSIDGVSGMSTTRRDEILSGLAKQ